MLHVPMVVTRISAARRMAGKPWWFLQLGRPGWCNKQLLLGRMAEAKRPSDPKGGITHGSWSAEHTKQEFDSHFIPTNNLTVKLMVMINFDGEVDGQKLMVKSVVIDGITLRGNDPLVAFEPMFNRHTG